MPTTAAETFFLSASDGDIAGMWFIASPVVFRLSLPVVLISLIFKLMTGKIAWVAVIILSLRENHSRSFHIFGDTIFKLSTSITVWHSCSGEGLPGFVFGALEGASYLALVSSTVTEVLKFAQGMQGGETGTGGRFWSERGAIVEEGSCALKLS